LAKKEKVKKPFYKKWWVWVIAIIVVIAIAGGGEEDDSTTVNSQPKSENTKTEAKADVSSKKEEKKDAYAIGDTVKVGKMEYKINGKSTGTSVGPSVLPTEAKGKFLVLDVTVKNNGNEAVMVDSSFFKLKRGEKTYEADAAASLSANQGEDGNIKNGFLADELNPDSEMTGKVVFDVAADAADATDLSVQVQTGVFGTETEAITLK